MHKVLQIAMFLAVMLALATPVLAQDAPFVTNTPTVDVTPEPGQSLIELPSEPLPTIITFLTGALVGVFATLSSALMLVGRLKTDKAALDAIEWLGKSIPVDALDKLNEMGRNLRDAGEVLDKVTDRQPNAVTE